MIEDCLKIFDEVVVAIMVNPNKKPFFSEMDRKQMLELMFQGEERIKIVFFTGAAVELLEQENTKFYVRGIRNGIDLDYENADYYASRKLDKELVEIYLPCRQELLHISSSIVRNSLRLNKPIDEYVTKEVKQFIQKKI